jgi:hypothetical protein
MTRTIPSGLLLLASWLIPGCGNDSDVTRAGELQVTASAEGLGADGYAFPPRAAQELAFVDGWAVDFQRILVAIDNVRLSEMPDKNPSDASVTGVDILLKHGPFIVDLSAAGNAEDKGGAGRVAIRLPIEDLKNRFDLEQRYAFGYDLVPASPDAVLVNVEPDDPDLLQMIERGERALLLGRAQFKGQNCATSDATYDFGQLPKSVRFRFGLKGAVHYRNCQNPDNQGAALPGEEAQRGIQMYPNRATTAQITLHTDHLFWASIDHENLPLFDQFAANASLGSDGSYLVELDALESVPVPRITDRQGSALPWRSCVASALYALPTQPPSMTFDFGSRSLENLKAFVELNARSMGHLNADGLCYVAAAE